MTMRSEFNVTIRNTSGTSAVLVSEKLTVKHNRGYRH